MTRDEIFKAINEERDRQINLDSTRTDGHKRTLADWIIVAQVKFRRMMNAWYDFPGETRCREELVKVATICVAALECDEAK